MLDAEVVVRLAGSRAGGLYQQAAVFQVLRGLRGFDAKQARVLLQVQAGVFHVQLGFFLSASGRNPSEQGDADRGHHHRQSVAELLVKGRALPCASCVMPFSLTLL